MYTQRNQRKNHIDLKKIFPNELNSRNIVAVPGTVFAFDLCQLKTKNRKKPKDSFSVLFGLDHATNLIILFTIFVIPNAKKGQVSAKKVVNAMRESLSELTLASPFIIHTDRGPQFTSQEYHDFIRDIGAIGSMSDPSSPTQNSLPERLIRTIRDQLKYLCGEFPLFVNSLTELQAFATKKKLAHNHEFKPKRACGLTPVHFDKVLQSAFCAFSTYNLEQP